MCDSITIIIFKLLTFLFLRCHFLTTNPTTMVHIYRILFIIISYSCQLNGKILYFLDHPNIHLKNCYRHTITKT